MRPMLPDQQKLYNIIHNCMSILSMTVRDLRTLEESAQVYVKYILL